MTVSKTKRMTLATVAWVTHTLVFIPLYHLIGPIVTTLTTLPVAVTGWLFGGRVGVLAGLLAFLLNTLLVTLAGDSGWDTLTQKGLPGSILIVLVGAVAGQIRDLSAKIKLELDERERAEETLRQRNLELALLNQASQALNATLDLDQVLTLVLEKVRHLMGIVACSIWLIDPATDELICRQASGSQSEVVRGWHLAPGEGIAGWVARYGESLIVPDTREDEHHFRDVDQRTGLPIRSILSIPLKIKQSVIGVLQVTDTEVNRFDTTDLTLLEPLSASAAIAIDNARLVKALRQHTIELKARNEELERFTYVASHNLRAPLINIQGFAAELGLAFGTITSAMTTALPYLGEEQRQAITTLQEDIPEALDFIDSSVTHLYRLTNALSELSRLSRRELDLEPVDMNTLVQETLQTLSHQIAQHQVKVTVDPLPNVIADRTSMKQIMDNLLNNAVLYLVPDRLGEIEITTESNHDEIAFHIRDNGRGIAKQDMHKVFAPFRRVGKSNVPGEGMGLAYVQTLIRRHGGRIWCESEPGIGTTFTFTIPNHPTEMI